VGEKLFLYPTYPQFPGCWQQFGNSKLVWEGGLVNNYYKTIICHIITKDKKLFNSIDNN
jgi:hypothetical protein